MLTIFILYDSADMQYANSLIRQLRSNSFRVKTQEDISKEGYYNIFSNANKILALFGKNALMGKERFFEKNNRNKIIPVAVNADVENVSGIYPFLRNVRWLTTTEEIMSTLGGQIYAEADVLVDTFSDIGSQFSFGSLESRFILPDQYVGPPRAISPIPIDEPTRDSIPECVVCLDKLSNCVFVGCGHVCVCERCARRLHECPVCRNDAEYIKVYY